MEMDLTKFISYASICVIIVTGLWPFNVPIMALAYKARHGYPPIPLEQKELWLRSTFASIGLAVLAVVLAGLNYLGVGVLGIPELPVQLPLLVLYIPAAAAFLFWAFAFDEPLDGLSLLAIYVGLPLILLLLINWKADFLDDYRQVKTWFGARPQG